MKGKGPSSYIYKLKLRPEERKLLRVLINKGYAKGIYTSSGKIPYGRYKMRKALYKADIQELVRTSIEDNFLYMWVKDIFQAYKITDEIKEVINEDIDSHVIITEDSFSKESELTMDMIRLQAKTKLGIEDDIPGSFEEYMKELDKEL